MRLIPTRVLSSLVTLLLAAATAPPPTTRAASPSNQDSAAAVQALATWLTQPRAERPDLTSQSFASTPLTREHAAHAQNLLWSDHAGHLRSTRTAEMKAKRLEINGKTMLYDFKVYGEKPASGHSLFLSLHGGGGAPPAVNDRQWANQLRLGDSYLPKEGIYVAPRAPTDTWDLWHQAHIDTFIDRLIENFLVLEDINPDRVFLLGYSAGGDGVYQLAPRIADRFAAAAMMAGHPNEASPLGLRNIGFALHMGALDSAYRRNDIARQWATLLAELQSADPDGYRHQVEIHQNKSHWMELADRAAIPWMETFTRNPRPAKIAWRQDDVIHPQFYWLAVNPAQAQAGDEIIAERRGSTFTLRTSRALTLSLWLDDLMIDADQPVTVTVNGTTAFTGHLTRTLAALHQSLLSRGQPQFLFPMRLDLPPAPAGS